MDALLQDLKFAFKLLWKDKAFTLTAVLTLALCLGANTAIYTVVRSVLLKPLPTPESERIMLMYNAYPKAGVGPGVGANGVPDYYDRLRETDVFEEQALFRQAGQTIGVDGSPERVASIISTPSLLRLLRATAYRGSLFTEEHGEVGKNSVVVLTYGLWQRLYGGRDDAIGQQMRISGTPHTIIGVLPPDFQFISPDIRFFTPVAFTPEQKSDDARHSNNWQMLGRLKPGATLEQAQAQIDALNARNLDRFPNLKELLIDAGFHTVVVPYQEQLVRDIRGVLNLLWGGVLFVLLIGCVNIASLALVRSAGRLKEFAMRQALGAARARVARQLVTESVVVALVGGGLGLALGYWGLNLLAGLGLERLPRGHEVGMDATVVLFVAGLTLAVGLVVGLIPVAGLFRLNLNAVMREEGRSATGGRSARLIRRVLVTGQVAFALVLLTGAGLLFASFQRLLAVDPGFEVGNVMTGSINPPASRYAGAAELRAFTDRVLSTVRTLPGVVHAGLTSSLPFSGNYSDSVILAEGYVMAPGESLISPNQIAVSPGYFEAMGIELVRGRFFRDSDTADSTPAVIVDERLARKFWGDTDPIGRRMFQPDNPDNLLVPGPNVRWLTVVGVVRDHKLTGLVNDELRPGTYYYALGQSPRRALTFAIRTAGEPGAIVPMLRRELAAIDPEVPLFGVLTMEERMDASLTDRRTPMILAVTFGAVALFLSAIGLYGMLAYQVAQRRREIGIRIALGGARSSIVGLVMREAALVVVIGFALGLAGTAALGRAIESQLFGVTTMDPVVLTAVCGTLGLVAMIAAAVPARRATRIDPAIALAQE